MSAMTVLRDARAAGVWIRVDGSSLVLEAEVPPPPDLLERLVRHKPEILALLRPEGDEWSAEDWGASFDERAGIAEFDGGLPRPEAEALALQCCIDDWLDRNGVKPSLDQSVHGGKLDHYQPGGDENEL
jgi:hypothetical protein